jgi:uncharacterized protein
MMHLRLSACVRPLLGGLLAWLTTVALAQAVLPVPALSGHLVDTTATLNAEQSLALETKLAAFERDKGTQLVFLLVPTTQPEDIASYANRVANSWKVGRKGIGDGLLLVLAKNDRKVRIEVAKTLEGAIPDLAAKQIIDEAITPHFRQGDFYAGLDAGADRILALVSGEALPAPVHANGRAGADVQWMDLAVFLFFVLPVAGTIARRILGPKFGSLITGGIIGLLALLFSSSLLIAIVAGLVAMLFTFITGTSRGMSSGSGWGGGTGGWRSGSGGGGFSSGGGGDFGGGGASGDW